MNILKKFMRNDNADLEETEYDDGIYMMPDDFNPKQTADEEDDTVSALNNPARKEPEIRPASSEKVSVKLLRPQSHTEATKIADNLKEGSIVLLDISGLERSVVSHLIDFLTGVAYVLGGEMVRTNKYTILISPTGVDIASITDMVGIATDAVETKEAEAASEEV